MGALTRAWTELAFERVGRRSSVLVRVVFGGGALGAAVLALVSLAAGCGGAQAKHGMRPGAVPTHANESAGSATAANLANATVGPAGEEPWGSARSLPAGLMSVTDSGGCVVHRGEVRCWRGTVNGGEHEGFEGLAHYEGPRGVPGVARWVSGDAIYGCAVVQPEATSSEVGGEVWCWGDNSAGQLGARIAAVRSARAKRVAGVGAAVQVAASRWHACALTRQGEVFCWGDNDAGQTGQPEDYVNELRAWVRAERVPGVERAVRVGVVDGTSCALLEASAGWGTCWGREPPAAWEPVQAPGGLWLMPALRGARDWSWRGECGCAVFDERVECRSSKEGKSCGSGVTERGRALKYAAERVTVGRDFVCAVPPVSEAREAGSGQAGALVCRYAEGTQRKVELGGAWNFGLGEDLCLHYEWGVECIAVGDWRRGGEAEGGAGSGSFAAMRIALPFSEPARNDEPASGGAAAARGGARRGGNIQPPGRP